MSEISRIFVKIAGLNYGAECAPPRRNEVNDTMLAIIFYLFLCIACTVMMAVSALTLVLLRPFDPARRCIHEQSRLLTRLFFCIPPAWRTEVRGLEKIDRRTPYVITINHSNMVDIPLLYWLPLNFRWVSKREVFRTPFFGQFLVLHGDICIDRSSSGAMAKVIEQGKKWLGRGASVAIFPEGTRSKDGEIHRFKAGAFSLAKESGTAILPVVFHGSDTLFIKGWRLPWRHTFRIEVLDPVPAETVAATDVKALSDMVRERMVAAKEELKKR